MPLPAQTSLPSWDRPDLGIIQEKQASPPSFPLRHLGPDLSKWVSAAAQSLNVPADFVAAPLLTAIAGLIGNTRLVGNGSYLESASIWAISVGPPSDGKTQGAKPIIRVLEEIERSLSLAGGAYENDESDDSEPHLLISDATPAAAAALAAASPKGLLKFDDEATHFCRRYQRDPFWLAAFNGSRHTVHRKSKPPLKIERLTVSIWGACQPEPLRDVLLTARGDHGFVSRWLYVFPEAIVTYSPMRHISSDPLRHALHRLATLDFDNGKPVALDLNPFGKDTADKFNAECHAWKHEHDGVVAGWIGKLPAMALRLALIFELMWWAQSEKKAPPGQVSGKAYEAAAKLLKGYFYPMMKRTLAQAETAREEHSAKRLARLLRREKLAAFNARDLRRQHKGTLADLATSDRLQEAIQVLSDACLVRHIGVRSGSTKGRAPRDFEVNPALLSN